MTLLSELTDWKIDIATRNVVFEQPGVYQVITGKDVPAQNITIDLIYNRGVSRLLADNPDPMDATLQQIASWVEEDPFVIKGSAKVELSHVTNQKKKLHITASLKEEADIELVLAV